MTTFASKTCQQQVLDSVEACFKACHELPSPSIAFIATTEHLWGRGNASHPLSGFPPDMPYLCLRVPTGGGKTRLAAKSVALVNTHLLRCGRSVILWLVPSKPIRDLTLRALRDRLHPYHAALREAGPITVMDLDEAKSVTRATLETSTTIFVATRQAFQVGDDESRKVYQSSGALMHPFENLSPTQRDGLLNEGEGTCARWTRRGWTASSSRPTEACSRRCWTPPCRHIVRRSMGRLAATLPLRTIALMRSAGCQARSNRSAFMIFVQAATKSRTNFSRLSSCA